MGFNRHNLGVALPKQVVVVKKSKVPRQTSIHISTRKLDSFQKLGRPFKDWVFALKTFSN